MKIVAAFILSLVALVSTAGATFSDSFTTAPTAWRTHNPGAVAWNAAAQNLNVTWDSRQTNSFFYYALPYSLNRQDTFSIELTLRLDDVQLAIDPTKKGTFELCFGFLDIKQATRSNYFRGSGRHATYGPRSVVEFDYFPPSTIEPTVGPIIAGTNNQIAASHSFPVEFVPGETYRIEMAFEAATQTLHTTILHNGEPFGEPGSNAIRPLPYPADFADFAVDAFSIHRYSDAGQSPPQFAGSLLAHGAIDDVTITWPDPPLETIALRREHAFWIASFAAKINWTYTLQRTLDFVTWEDVASEAGADAELNLTDSDPPPGPAFYRVVATRP